MSVELMFRDFAVEERKEESSGGGRDGNDGTVCNLRRSDFSIKIRVAWLFFVRYSILIDV